MSKISVKRHNKPITVIFAEDDSIFKRVTIQTALNKLHQNGATICLIRSFLSDPADIGNCITAQVCSPLLGLRLIKAIELCDTQGLAELSK
ncbi:hypothetical protein O9992_27720 [Vibrio lentus]|nr:hypothetical protein [Vibrio lentus]